LGRGLRKWVGLAYAYPTEVILSLSPGGEGEGDQIKCTKSKMYAYISALVIIKGERNAQ